VKKRYLGTCVPVKVRSPAPYTREYSHRHKTGNDITAPWVHRSFNQLAELLDSEKASRMDKVTIISDAVKAVTQLRAEAHQLRQFKKLLEVGGLNQMDTYARYRRDTVFLRRTLLSTCACVHVSQCHQVSQACFLYASTVQSICVLLTAGLHCLHPPLTAYHAPADRNHACSAAGAHG